METKVSLSNLPTTRRLVTGHDKNGKSIVEFDEVLKPFNPFPETTSTSVSLLGITLIHRTRGFPVKIQGSVEELASDNVRRSRGEQGVVCQIVDLPPTRGGHLHRNQSLDYGVVLKGTMQIVLDDGVEETLREGDVYIQKGTIHAWKNTSTEYCRFLTVVIPSEQVKLAESGEILEVTKLPGLSD